VAQAAPAQVPACAHCSPLTTGPLTHQRPPLRFLADPYPVYGEGWRPSARLFSKGMYHCEQCQLPCPSWLLSVPTSMQPGKGRSVRTYVHGDVMSSGGQLHLGHCHGDSHVYSSSRPPALGAERHGAADGHFSQLDNLGTSVAEFHLADSRQRETIAIRWSSEAIHIRIGNVAAVATPPSKLQAPSYRCKP
jgi:hypothetical protein